MAYCRLIPGTCTVSCSVKREGGTDVFVPNAPVMAGMNVNQFAAFYPGYISVPPHCKTPTPGGPGGPGGKYEDPDDPVPPSCDPAVPVPILPPGDDYPPGVVPSGLSGGTGHPGQQGTLAHWNQPIVGKLTWLPVVASMGAERPNYSREPAHIYDAHGRMVVARWGTGQGLLFLHAPELGPQHLYGYKGNSGTNDAAIFPDVVSETGLVVFTALAESEVGNHATGIIGFGKRVPGTNKPGLGWYMTLDPSTLSAKMAHTDANGDDIAESVIRIYNNAGTWTMVFGTDATKYDMPGTLDPKVLWMKLVEAASVATPPAGQKAYFADVADGVLKSKDSDENVATVGGATEEDIATAVAAHLLANPPTVADGSVTSAKLADMAEGTLKGRAAGAGTGVPSDRTMAQVKTDLVLVKGDVGLGNVDNTSDANKPVSTAQQTALDAKMPLVNQLASANAVDQDNTTTTNANITGLSATVEAGAKYRFQIRLRYSTLSLGGFKLDLDGGTATMTAITYSTEIITAVGTAGSNVIAVNTTALATDLTLANNTTVTDLICRIEGYMRVNGAGTFIPRFSRTNSAGTARARDGCSMVLEKCA